MIHIENDGFWLAVRGHAMAGDSGEDIVCSAVSMLVYTLVRAVLKREKDMKREPTVILESGNALIDCDPRHPAELKIIYQAILDGLELVTNEYPNNVSWDRK